MTKAAIRTASLLAFSALSEARDATTLAEARCCLETACGAVRRLTAADALSWALIGEIEATRAALAPLGFDVWPAVLAKMI